jgi:membrane-associated protease RseP (regulator of RpoE activity)
MLSLARGGGRLPLKAFAVALGLLVFTRPPVLADVDGHGDHNEGRFKHGHLGYGTLGWAEYGLYPGLYGFSLRWHPGYGYGRYALGVGSDGGYPNYAGPGYPHDPPKLRRFGPARPYTYYGPPDYVPDGCTNYFTHVDGLVIEKPVVTIGEPGDFGYVNENGDVYPGRDFGSYTGTLPYPETLFAPYASAAAATGSSGAEGPARPATAPYTPPAANPGPPSASLAPADGEVTTVHAPGRYIGIEEEPSVDANGVRGIKVAHVLPGSAAEKAGLQPGDVIHSTNGYLTTDRGNLAWITAVATPNNVLRMTARTASDGKLHTILVDLRTAALNTKRPSFLPRVGNGPPPSTR